MTILFPILSLILISSLFTLLHYCFRCEQEEEKLTDLQAKRIKEENITKHFQNNNAEIRKIAEDKVRDLLSNRRDYLNLAVLCIMESIRENPEKVQIFS